MISLASGDETVSNAELSILLCRRQTRLRRSALSSTTLCPAIVTCAARNCRPGCSPRRPTAVGIASHGAFGTPRGLDPHRGPGIGPAPEAALGILLEHHVAADDLGQFDLGRGTPCGGKANKGQNEFLISGGYQFPANLHFSGNREYRAHKNDPAVNIGIEFFEIPVRKFGLFL